MNANELTWGIRVNRECRAAWGARMYVETWQTTSVVRRRRESVTKRQLVTLPDRQDLQAAHPDDRAALLDALNRAGGVIDRLREMAAKGELDGDMDEDLRLDVPGVEVLVRAYGGYVHAAVLLP